MVSTAAVSRQASFRFMIRGRLFFVNTARMKGSKTQILGNGRVAGGVAAGSTMGIVVSRRNNQRTRRGARARALTIQYPLLHKTKYRYRPLPGTSPQLLEDIYQQREKPVAEMHVITSSISSSTEYCRWVSHYLQASKMQYFASKCGGCSFSLIYRGAVFIISFTPKHDAKRAKSRHYFLLIKRCTTATKTPSQTFEPAHST